MPDDGQRMKNASTNSLIEWLRSDDPKPPWINYRFDCADRLEYFFGLFGEQVEILDRSSEEAQK